MNAKKRNLSPNSGKMSDKDAMDLLEKTGKQYQVYRELQDVAKLAQRPVSPAPVMPSAECPLNTTLAWRK